MIPSQSLPVKIRKAGISIDDKWEPGNRSDLCSLKKSLSKGGDKTALKCGLT
jgi:hypothetical protein